MLLLRLCHFLKTSLSKDAQESEQAETFQFNGDRSTGKVFSRGFSQVVGFYEEPVEIGSGKQHHDCALSLESCDHRF